MNPVLARETRTRFRGRRAAWLLTVWVLVLGLLTYLIYLGARSFSGSGFGIGALFGAGFIGAFTFEAITLLLVTAIVFLVPAIAAPAIVSERERQTFHLLQVTQMTPTGLVLGKFAASIAYVLVLLVAVIPVAAIPLLFGGVRFGDVMGALGMLAVTAVMLAAVSIWASSRAASTRGAVALSYLFAAVIAWASFLGMLGEFAFRSDAFRVEPVGGIELVSALPNPYMGMASAVLAPLEVQQGFGSQTLYAPFQAYLELRQRGPDGALNTELTEDGRRVVESHRPPLWLYTVAIYLVIGALALWRASINVRAPGPRIATVKRVRNGDS